MIRRGFTVVELIITITIMGILLLLTVVNVGSSQLRSRDDERTTDVQSIGLILEAYYNGGSDTSTITKRYPTTSLVSSVDSMTTTLEGVDTKILKAPGTTTPLETFIAATNANQDINTVAPQPTINQYVYQPLLPNGTLCTGTLGTEDCRKFNIYYRLEKDNVVRFVTSKNQ